MRYFIGVDGGATKTLAVLANEKGEILGHGLAGPSNYHNVGIEGAVRAIEEAVSRALSQAGVDKVSVACYGLAGIDTKRDHDTFYPHVSRLPFAEKHVLVHDSIIALLGATAGRPGVIVIAGTGSVAAGLNAEGRYVRAGGWGPILGDEGSAYDIARRALIAALHYYDGRGPKTMLLEAFLKAMGLSEPEDIITKIYCERVGVTYIAGLAPVVTECARKGDEVARAILEEAGRELAKLAIAVIKRLRMEREAFPIALVGGVFKAGDLVIKPFEREVTRVAPRAEISRPRFPPCIGALILAMREGGVQLTDTIIGNLAEGLAKIPA